ncbi:MAG: M28 family peptidase [Bacteroidota bacterium]
MRPLLLALFLLLCGNSVAQNQIPQIRNLTVGVNTQEVEVTFALEDAENDEIEITFQVSEDGGNTYTTQTTGITGDVGFPISTGSLKQLSWDFSQVSTPVNELWVRVIADDRVEIDIQTVVDQVDKARLLGDMTFFEGRRHRSTGTTLLRATKDSMEQLFIQQDIEASRQAFDYNGYMAHNLIGRKAGIVQAGKVYIVGGHFDTVSNSPGADDNASGFVGMMEACRVLAPYDFESTVKFVGFDLEETGLIGSGRFVADGGIADFEEIGGMLNLEMIGYFDTTANTQTLPTGFEVLFPEAWAAVNAQNFRGNFITNVGNNNSADFYTAFNSAAASYVPQLRVVSLLADAGPITPPDFLRSDHAQFWLGGHKALMITDGAEFRNPNYHSPNDLVSTIDFDFMSDVVKATVATLAEQAVIRHSSSQALPVDQSSSVQELDCHFNIFPNPNDQLLRLQLQQCPQQPTEIHIYTLDGRLMHRSAFAPDGTFEVTTQAWPAGLYLLHMTDGVRSSSRKFMVRH